MGFHKVVYLYCDGGPDCPLNGDEVSSADMGAENITDYKAAMKKEGWRFTTAGRAYCPDCKNSHV